MIAYGMTIDGPSVSTAETCDVKNPSIDEIAGCAPNATVGDLETAVAAAKAAFARWSKTSDDERRVACAAVAAKISDNAEELAQIVTAEQGKPLNGLGSRCEVSGGQQPGRATPPVCRCR